MRRILLAAAATAIVVAGSYAVRAVGTDPASSPAQAASSPGAVNAPVAYPPAAASPSPATASSNTPTELDRLIGVFEARTATSDSSLNFITLGSHYYRRASLTGNIGDYEAAATAYGTAYSLAPGDRSAQLGYAQAAAAIHDFTTAYELAAVAMEADPTDRDALAIQADAALEIGNLDEAAQLLNRLDTVVPDNPAVLARLANLAHLQGRQDEAIALAALAREEAERFRLRGRQFAFFPLLQADLFLDAGRYEEARSAAAEAVATAPRYAVTHASMGRVQSHFGELDGALVSYEKALRLQSDPGWRASAAEVLIALGRPDEADDYIAAARLELEPADEVIFGQSLAQLYLDFDMEPVEALRLAQEDLTRRQSIDAYDTLAWALYRNGRIAEARTASDRATATGAQDAGLLYHSALIAVAERDTDRAVSELTELLERNPGFHPLQSRHATELLASLSR